MKKGVFSILVTLSLVGCASTNPLNAITKDNRKANLHLKLGIEHLKAGNNPQALSELLLAKDNAPDNPVIHNNLGLAYYVRKKYKLALLHLKEALALLPSYTDARNNLGRVLTAVGQYKEAEVQLKKALEDLTYTQSAKTHTNLGINYFMQNKLKTSKSYLLKAIQMDRQFCPAYNYYGQIMFRWENYEKAASIFDRALKLCRKLPEVVHYYSALSYYKLGKQDQAIARFQEIIRLYPESDYSLKSESLLKVIRQERL